MKLKSGDVYYDEVRDRLVVLDVWTVPCHVCKPRCDLELYVWDGLEKKAGKEFHFHCSWVLAHEFEDFVKVGTL